MSQEEPFYNWRESPMPVKWPSTSPPGWGTSDWENQLHMWDFYRNSISPPQQARALSPTNVGLHERSLSPKRSKERPRSRSRSPERGSRIFLIDGHGAIFPDESGSQIALIDPVLVDTFTTSKFGCSFGSNLHNTQNYYFFDPPYTYVIPRILGSIGSLSRPSKDEVRRLLYSSLCETRDSGEGGIIKDTCRFKCHRVGGRIPDMYILGAGSPMDDQILMIDPENGIVEDVHKDFGLIEISKRGEIQGRKPIDRGFNTAIAKAEDKINSLNTEILTTPVTPENMDKIKKLMKKRDDMSSRLYTIRESLREGLRGPKYEYMGKHIGKYVNNDYVKNMIKLSDILQIAIINGTIDPKKDFVIIFACRNPIVPLSIEASKLGSPRGDGESQSQGGGGRVTSKHSRKKYANNKGRNKNKNKRKTIRNRKSIKSRNSRKSRKRSKSL
jgi:hypothetical protein